MKDLLSGGIAKAIEALNPTPIVVIKRNLKNRSFEGQIDQHIGGIVIQMPLFKSPTADSIRLDTIHHRLEFWDQIQDFVTH